MEMGKATRNGTRYRSIQKMLLTCMFCVLLSIVEVPFSLPNAYAQQRQGETIIVQITGATQPPGFLPALLSVHLYDTIVFINQSAPPAGYAITAQDGSFASPEIAHGEQWAVTMSTTGPHPYTVSSVSTMVGEIFVVSNAVALLPTPLAQAQATVGAALTAGKSPPDVTGLATATIGITNGGASPFTPLLILIVILNGVLTLSLLIALGIWLLMRRRAAKKALLASLEGSPTSQQGRASADDSQKETTKQKRRFFWQRRKGDEDEDIELDEDEE